MLVQRRGKGRLRLVEQHEHGLISGELARVWAVGAEGDGLPDTVVLATALHDLGWRALDARPKLDPDTGLPHDFMTFPLAEKYRAAAEGIDRVAELHPYAGVLVSLHYSELGKENAPVEFLEHEEERRFELLDLLGEEAPSGGRLRGDLAHLQLLDHLSLFLCLASPEAEEGTVPRWLSGEAFRPVEGYGALRARWTDPETVQVTPYPFRVDPLAVDVPVRDVAGAPFASQAELDAALAQAEDDTQVVELTSGA